MLRRRAPVRAAIVLAAAALVLAPVAFGKIVPQRGMAGVSLGMTRTNIMRVAGKPSRVEHKHNEFGSFTRFVYRDRSPSTSRETQR